MTYALCIVFNLANGIDVELTKERIEQYRRENQTAIMKNRQKQVRLLTTIANKWMDTLISM